jgi:hypothetical protein
MELYPSDHDLLVRVDERLRDVHEIVKGNGKMGLIDRVDSLERSRDETRGVVKGFRTVTYIGGAGGVMGTLAAIYHFLFRH